MHPLESYEIVGVAGGLSPIPLPLHGGVVPVGPFEGHGIGLPRLPSPPSPL